MSEAINNPESLAIVDIIKQSVQGISAYKNFALTYVNDHVVRISMMTEQYPWHVHPDSDESFIVIEGSLIIDLEDRSVELFPNQLFTIPKNTSHRTRPGGQRSVNLT